MSKHVDIADIKDRRTALKHATQEGYDICEDGPHTKVKYAGIVNPIPRHCGQFKPGLQHGIQKTFARMAAEKMLKAAVVAVPVLVFALVAAAWAVG